jgi:hypothetical protein
MPDVASRMLPPYRGILAVDTERFTGNPSARQPDLSAAVQEVLRVALERCGHLQIWEQRRFTSRGRLPPEKKLRLPSIGSVGCEYARMPGHATAPRQRGLEHLHRPPRRAGRRDPAGARPVPAQDPSTHRRDPAIPAPRTITRTRTLLSPCLYPPGAHAYFNVVRPRQRMLQRTGAGPGIVR